MVELDQLAVDISQSEKAEKAIQDYLRELETEDLQAWAKIGDIGTDDGAVDDLLASDDDDRKAKETQLREKLSVVKKARDDVMRKIRIALSHHLGIPERSKTESQMVLQKF